MSYNTRRTGGGVGRGTGATQVNYHQQPVRAPGNTAQQPTRSPSYTTQQGPVSYNSAAQPAYSTQQAYSTATSPAKPAANQPPLPAQPSAPKPPVTPDVKPQVTPVAKPPVTPAAKSPVTPAAKPPVTPAQLKVEPVTPHDTPSMETQENGEEQSSKPDKIPFWRKRAVLSSKVRKARNNAKLRRTLNPKNALTVLNELKPGKIKFIVHEESGWGYSAKLDIDGKTFTGRGMSVSKAKMHAAELALKDIMLEQIAKSASSAAPSEIKEEDKQGDEEMAVDEQGEDGEVRRKRPPPPEDEVPWGSLAAFALHKLFNEWRSESGESMPPMPMPMSMPEKFGEVTSEEVYYGQQNPDYFPRRFPGPYPHPAGRGRGYAGPYPMGGPPSFNMPRRPMPPLSAFLPGNRSAAAGIPQPMRKIPLEAGQRHPVMLLNQMKTDLVYNESREGATPNIIFAISVNVDGKDFVGRGRNKKEAKKNAAIAALSHLGIKCQEEIK